MKLSSVIIKLFLASACVGCVSLEGKYEHLTVEALVRSPESFQNKRVKLHGVIKVGGHFEMVIVDRLDSNQGVFLEFPSRVTPDVEALKTAVLKMTDDSLPSPVVTIVGVYMWHPGAKPGRVISVENVVSIDGRRDFSSAR